MFEDITEEQILKMVEDGELDQEKEEFETEFDSILELVDPDY